MIVFGIRLFGKAEIVPGLFFIATRFFHVCFIPLFPMQSWVILDDSQGGEAIALPGLHWGSISMAWLRGLALLGAAVLAYMAWQKQELHEPMNVVLQRVALALGCVACFAGSYWLARANAAGLEQLRSVPGLPSSLLGRAKEQLAPR